MTVPGPGSSLEHDGLGRYGDPLIPDGDVISLRRIRSRPPPPPARPPDLNLLPLRACFPSHTGTRG